MRRGHGFGTLSDRRHISSLCPSVPDDDINDRTEGDRKRGVEGERRAKESSLQLPVHAPLPPFHSTAQHLPLELEGK